MTRDAFRTPDGQAVVAVTVDEMRAVDRVAVEDVGLGLLQMMENAGRALAWHVRDARDGGQPVVVATGSGGNGGGGMACARHLANRGVPVRVVLDRPAADLDGAAATQYGILDDMGVPITDDAEPARFEAVVAVDALIGYGLAGPVRPPADSYIEAMNGRSDAVVSLDVPSGIDATTGETLRVAARPDRTVTLALPKAGLDAVDGTLYLVDIGIPAIVYDRLDIAYGHGPFRERDWVELERRD